MFSFNPFNINYNNPNNFPQEYFFSHLPCPTVLPQYYTIQTPPQFAGYPSFYLSDPSQSMFVGTPATFLQRPFFENFPQQNTFPPSTAMLNTRQSFLPPSGNPLDFPEIYSVKSPTQPFPTTASQNTGSTSRHTKTLQIPRPPKEDTSNFLLTPPPSSPLLYLKEFPGTLSNFSTTTQVQKEEDPGQKFKGEKEVRKNGRREVLLYAIPGSSLVHRFKCTKVENDIKTFVCAGCLEWSGSTIIKVIGTDFLSDPCKLKHHCKPVMRRKEKKEKKKKCRQEKKKRNLFEVLKEMVIKEPWRGERLRNGLLSAMKSHARLMSKSNEEKKKKLDEIVKLTTSVRLDTCYWKLLDTISSEDEKSGLTSEESYEEGVKLTSMEVLEFATNKAIDNINCTYVE
ncbi:hypothetical protein RB195_021359 [Necator americanus]|uniref:Uncharacterized protein n=1 Tax=Necator americanus TaxID=51031 RepID=A0ABR1EAW8_NECAM